MAAAPRSHVGHGVVAEDWYTNDYPDEEESDREDEADLSGEFLSSQVLYLQPSASNSAEPRISDEYHERSEYDGEVPGRSMTAYRDVMSYDF